MWREPKGDRDKDPLGGDGNASARLLGSELRMYRLRKGTHDLEGSQARVMRYDSEENQRAIVGVMNDTRRDDVNEDPLGGIARSLPEAVGQWVENVKAVTTHSRLGEDSLHGEIEWRRRGRGKSSQARDDGREPRGDGGNCSFTKGSYSGGELGRVCVRHDRRGWPGFRYVRLTRTLGWPM